MLKFWQFSDDEYVDCTPELYFSEEEISIGDNLIKEFVGNQQFGGLLITNRFESTGGRYDEKGNKMSLMKNPKGGYKKHKGSSLTMNLPVVKTHGGK